MQWIVSICKWRCIVLHFILSEPEWMILQSKQIGSGCESEWSASCDIVAREPSGVRVWACKTNIGSKRCSQPQWKPTRMERKKTFEHFPWAQGPHTSPLFLLICKTGKCNSIQFNTLVEFLCLISHVFSTAAFANGTSFILHTSRTTLASRLDNRGQSEAAQLNFRTRTDKECTSTCQIWKKMLKRVPSDKMQHDGHGTTHTHTHTKTN